MRPSQTQSLYSIHSPNGHILFVTNFIDDDDADSADDDDIVDFLLLVFRRADLAAFRAMSETAKASIGCTDSVGSGSSNNDANTNKGDKGRRWKQRVLPTPKSFVAFVMVSVSL